MQIRKATPKDCATILKFVKALAKLEGGASQVTNTVANLKKYGFGRKKIFTALIIESEKKPVGCAVYYNRYSTWRGKTIEVEDIYIDPKFRGKGMGPAVFSWIAREALATDCDRLEWQVYHRKLPKAVKLYKSFHTEFEKNVWRCQLNGKKAIARLAQKYGAHGCPV